MQRGGYRPAGGVDGRTTDGVHDAKLMAFTTPNERSRQREILTAWAALLGMTHVADER
jgi:hypothetical protein